MISDLFKVIVALAPIVKEFFTKKEKEDTERRINQKRIMLLALSISTFVNVYILNTLYNSTKLRIGLTKELTILSSREYGCPAVIAKPLPSSRINIYASGKQPPKEKPVPKKQEFLPGPKSPDSDKRLTEIEDIK